MIHPCGLGYWVHMCINIIREAASGPLASPGAVAWDDLGRQPSSSISLGYVLMRLTSLLFLPSLPAPYLKQPWVVCFKIAQIINTNC